MDNDFMKRLVFLLALFLLVGVVSATPPASITGLTNTTYNCGNISWQWTNPTDADFNHTYVLKNNVWIANYTNATTTALWTGLSNITAYTFSSKTVDITGNMNATWVNATATTAECLVVTPTPTPTPTVTVTPPSIDPNVVPWCGRQDLFFYNASSDISGYKKLKNYPELDTQRTITSPSITVSSGEVTLGTWISEPGRPGVIMLSPGSWDFRTYFTASSSAGATRAQFRAFNQTSGGTKTWFWFGTAIVNDIDKGDVPTKYELSYTRRNLTPFSSGDRLGIQINVSTDSASARTVTMDLAGNTNASMFSLAYFVCPVTTISTTAPTTAAPWQPLINPSTDTKFDFRGWITEWWWLPVLILIMILLLGRK